MALDVDAGDAGGERVRADRVGELASARNCRYPSRVRSRRRPMRRDGAAKLPLPIAREVSMATIGRIPWSQRKEQAISRVSAGNRIALRKSKGFESVARQFPVQGVREFFRRSREFLVGRKQEKTSNAMRFADEGVRVGRAIDRFPAQVAIAGAGAGR
jgi:hypothetical protein